MNDAHDAIEITAVAVDAELLTMEMAGLLAVAGAIDNAAIRQHIMEATARLSHMLGIPRDRVVEATTEILRQADKQRAAPWN